MAIPDPDFESERTAVWPRLAADVSQPVDPPPTVSRVAEPYAESSSSSNLVAPEARRSGGRIVAAIAAVALATVSLVALSRSAPTEVEQSASPAGAGALADLVVHAPEESTIRERKPPEVRPPSIEVPPAIEIEEAPAREEVIELDERDAAAAWVAKRRAIAERRARAEAGRLVQLATEALEAGRRAEAIPIYEQALELHPTLATAAAGLSSAYFDEGDFGLAVTYAERAVTSDESNAEHHVVLGDAYFRAGRADDARAAWSLAEALGSPRAKKRLAKLGS